MDQQRLLMARINFVAEQVATTQLPGVQGIANRLQKMGVLVGAVDSCLDLMGPRWGTTRARC
jgi:hypothetical protein